MARRAQPLELIPGLALRVSSLRPGGPETQAESSPRHLKLVFQAPGSTLTTSSTRALKVPAWRPANGQNMQSKRWTLLALNGRHLGYGAQEEEPFRQLFILFLKQWRTRCSGSTSVDHEGSCRDGGGGSFHMGWRKVNKGHKEGKK